MTGKEHIKTQMEGQKDQALIQTVNFLLSRNDMENKFLNEEKNIKDMAEFIKKKGREHCTNGWNYITNEVVYAWAIMYFSLPNKVLKIEKTKSKKETKKEKPKDEPIKNNVISMETAKAKIEEKKEVMQISLFGGAS